MTIPNILTLGRIFLTPVLAWLLIDRRYTAAMGVFFIAGVTDALDGLVARVFNQKSKFGAYLDPLADKILLVTSFIIMGYEDQIPLWLVIIVVSRDAMILLGFFTLAFYQVKIEINPLVSSKLTTLFQLTTVFMLLLKPILAFPGWMYSILFIVTAGFSLLSGARYLYVGMNLIEKHRTRNTDS